MSDDLRYRVPYRLLAAYLTRPVMNFSRSDITAVYRGFVARMHPGPVVRGIDNLPASGRFVLAANHYQRKQLWVAHAASALSMIVADRYAADPPIRWLVTGNWPRWRIGPLSIPSPGDVLLPRVAHAAWCYAVPFAGTNPAVAAGSIRRLLKDETTLACPIGIFPEGADARAGRLAPPLQETGRLFKLLAERGRPVVPAGISEQGRLVIRIGVPIAAVEVCRTADPAALVMQQIEGLIEQRV